ncbi:VanZ family protein [Corynebacterium lizhenjunii]|uniref:VanZ family protein n=1 Tax=Corynebacterium lizhenjunii TaxID=2709394 RepID=UPI0013EB03CF|nr:VanZ family protein [Corynebacterium lizhenjunii]
MSPSNRRLLAIATAAYIAVVVALTTLKSFYRIGYLWEPARQRARELHLVPLDSLGQSSWFAPLFDYGGNLAFFIPVGVLFFMWRERIGPAIAWAAALSLSIEVSQYLFSLGRSDIDDLLFNTLGGALGAVFAKWCGPRFYRVWMWLAVALGVVFAVLVALGPRLGNPELVKDLDGASSPASATTPAF